MADVAKVNLQINQGATFRHKFTRKDSKGRPNNFTGYVARLQARESVESDIAVITLTTENGGIVLGGASGTISLYISDEDTALITTKKLVYDLELVAPNGDVIRVVSGSINVSFEVTRV
jgi:hypothetical protein